MTFLSALFPKIIFIMKMLCRATKQLKENNLEMIPKTISGDVIKIGESYATREGHKVKVIAFNQNYFGIQIIGTSELGGLEWCHNGRYFYDSTDKRDLFCPWKNATSTVFRISK